MTTGEKSRYGPRLRVPLIAALAALGLFLAAPALTVATAVASATPASAPSAPQPVPGSAGLPGPPTVGGTVPDGTQGKVAGMAIPNVSQQQSPDEVTRLRSDGLNTISVFVWWVMQKQDSNTVGPDYKDGITETDADVELQMESSVHAGMHVILVPIFYCLTCQGGWRGTIAPADTTQWFASYQSFINHYADLAQSHGATTLFIGSEMTSMEQYSAQWEQVIGATRTHFSGQIGYQENWDVLGQAKFLSDVDLIGVSAYFPLDDAQSPALSDLLADWTDSHAGATRGRNWVSELSSLARSTGKPILFGEAGYMSGDHAAKQPFLNYLDTTNWQLQSDLYQALLETFSGQSWWAGVVWWEWYLTSDSQSDNDRSPRGKTAEEMLHRWYAQGERPSSPDNPLVYSLPQYSPDDGEIPRASPTPAGSSPSKAGPGAATGATGTSASPASRSTRAARPGARAQGAGAGASPTGGASRAAGAGATAAATAGRSGSGHLSGSGRTTAILASVALVLILIALVLVGALRRPGSAVPAARTPPPRP